MNGHWYLTMAICLTMALCACDGTGGADGDMDADSDTDADSDADGDTDSDTDADSDTDSDADTNDCLYIIMVPSGQDGDLFLGDGATLTDLYLPLSFDIQAPQADPDNYPPELGIDIEIYWGIAGDEDSLPDSLCWSGTVAQGAMAHVTCPLEGLVDGDEIIIDALISDEGEHQCPTNGWDSWLSKTLHYRADGEAIRIDSCYVLSACVNEPLRLRCAATAPWGMGSLTDGWSAQSDVASLTGEGGLLHSGETLLEAADAGLHEVSVTATDGVSTSAVFPVSVPVDEWEVLLSFAFFRENVGEITSLGTAILPDRLADLLALSCDPSFDSGLKPATPEDAPYGVDLDPDCAIDVFAGLGSDDMELLHFYPCTFFGEELETAVVSIGDIVEELFASGTPLSSAQITWRHH